jgi:hypothetical protein
MQPKPSPANSPASRPTVVVYRICGRPGQNDRPALPAGHPVSWGLLVNGTTLHGARYPYPVFP